MQDIREKYDISTSTTGHRDGEGSAAVEEAHISRSLISSLDDASDRAIAEASTLDEAKDNLKRDIQEPINSFVREVIGKLSSNAAEVKQYGAATASFDSENLPTEADRNEDKIRDTQDESMRKRPLEWLSTDTTTTESTTTKQKVWHPN